MTKLACDFDIVMYATKTSLLNAYNKAAAEKYYTEARTCRFHAGLTKGKFIVSVSLISIHDNSMLVEYASVGDTLLDALYNILEPTKRNFYN